MNLETGLNYEIIFTIAIAVTGLVVLMARCTQPHSQRSTWIRSVIDFFENDLSGTYPRLCTTKFLD